MRSYLIIFSSPLFNQYLSFLKSRENFPVKQFISELAVKGFNITILPGAAPLNKERLYSQPVKPSPYCFSGKLRTIIRSDMLRDTPKDEKIK
jgi:hypothetical protein